MGLRQTMRPSKPEPSAQVEEDGNMAVLDEVPLDQTNKSFAQRVTPVIACGSGLFSDGYLNGVCAFPLPLNLQLRSNEKR